MEVFSGLDPFFVDEIEAAEERLHLELSPRAKLYLIHVLKELSAGSRFFHAEIVQDRPLAVVLLEALHKSIFEKLRDLKVVGDLALIFSGLYPDHLTRRLVDVDYFMMLGRKSYHMLADLYGAHPSKQELFALYSCLVAEFSLLIRILTEISAGLKLMDDSDLSRLLRRWQRTGIDTYRRLLDEHKIVPLDAPEDRWG